MLSKDWKKIVRKAWSIRLMVLAGLLSAAEVILPMFSDQFPRNVFAVLSLIAIAGGFVTRLMAQKEFSNDA